MLKKAYEEYFKSNTLFAQNLVICVVEVDGENIKKISPFYNQNLFYYNLGILVFDKLVKNLMSQDSHSKE